MEQLTKVKLKKLEETTNEVVIELVGEHALPVIEFLKGKTKISEFIIAEELDLEINETRNILYKLLEHNIVSFLRKKDKIKGHCDRGGSKLLPAQRSGPAYWGCIQSQRKTGMGTQVRLSRSD